MATIAPPSHAATRVVAGIDVPDTPVIALALDRARSESDPYLFNHAVRSWLFAARTAQLQSIPHDGEVLAVGTLLHDLTLTKDFKGARRFEVEAADLARAFVRGHGFDDRRAQLVWDSVALNSTPSIGSFKEAEVALCMAGIGLDYDERLASPSASPVPERGVGRPDGRRWWKPMRGRIAVDSTPAVGTRFRFTVPIAVPVRTR